MYAEGGEEGGWKQPMVHTGMQMTFPDIFWIFPWFSWVYAGWGEDGAQVEWAGHGQCRWPPLHSAHLTIDGSHYRNWPKLAPTQAGPAEGVAEQSASLRAADRTNLKLTATDFCIAAEFQTLHCHLKKRLFRSCTYSSRGDIKNRIGKVLNALLNFGGFLWISFFWLTLPGLIEA